MADLDQLSAICRDSTNSAFERRRAIAEIGRCQDAPRHAASLLLELLQDRDRDVRLEAAGSLAAFAGREVTTGLIALLTDGDEGVRRAAIDALRKRGDPAAIGPLREHEADASFSVRYAVQSAVAELERFPASTVEAKVEPDAPPDVSDEAMIQPVPDPVSVEPVVSGTSDRGMPAQSDRAASSTRSLAAARQAGAETPWQSEREDGRARDAGTNDLLLWLKGILGDELDPWKEAMAESARAARRLKERAVELAELRLARVRDRADKEQRIIECDNVMEARRGDLRLLQQEQSDWAARHAELDSDPSAIRRWIESVFLPWKAAQRDAHRRESEGRSESIRMAIREVATELQDVERQQRLLAEQLSQIERELEAAESSRETATEQVARFSAKARAILMTCLEAMPDGQQLERLGQMGEAFPHPALFRAASASFVESLQRIPQLRERVAECERRREQIFLESSGALGELFGAISAGWQSRVSEREAQVQFKAVVRFSGDDSEGRARVSGAAEGEGTATAAYPVEEPAWEAPATLDARSWAVADAWKRLGELDAGLAQHRAMLAGEERNAAEFLDWLFSALDHPPRA